MNFVVSSDLYIWNGGGKGGREREFRRALGFFTFIREIQAEFYEICVKESFIIRDKTSGSRISADSRGTAPLPLRIYFKNIIGCQSDLVSWNSKTNLSGSQASHKHNFKIDCKCNYLVSNRKITLFNLTGSRGHLYGTATRK